jgi:uncharacterized membrane protein YgdD (TMEM256/DUF423 family)
MKITANYTFIGACVLFFSVALGAFGAHILEKMLDPKALETFHVGVDYQFYHGLALLLVGVVERQLKVDLSKVAWAFILGILLFSLNCYLYAIFKIPFLVMLIPLGGTFFLVGWVLLAIKTFRMET